MKALLKSNKGQSMIELLILLPALITVIQLLFVMTWIFINLTWMKHQLYQAILCVAQEREQTFCHSKLLRDIKKINPQANITSLHFNSSKGKIQWRFYKQDFIIRQNFQLSF